MFIVTHQPNLLEVCDQVLTLTDGRTTVRPGPGGGAPRLGPVVQEAR